MKVGKLSSYNEALGQENEELREKLRKIDGRRRHRVDDTVSDQPKKRRIVQYSSADKSGEELDESARVRLKFASKLTFFFNFILNSYSSLKQLN